MDDQKTHLSTLLIKALKRRIILTGIKRLKNEISKEDFYAEIDHLREQINRVQST